VPKLETSPEHPAPLRVVALRIGDWIGRLGEVWVEGQIAQLNRRPGAATCFLTLRDPDANISMTVTCPRAALPDAVTDGSRVVLRARPDFYLERGTLTLRATDIRPVGVGALLARLDELRRMLAAEGLFAPERKRRLPLLPRTIGLITGRASAAERDVVENARRRLPAVRFRVENVATQGPTAANEVIAALERLDADPEVDVIVIARGGGSVEDLLPFSNESVVRAVFAARTPVVSAIGHETDVPLLDHVADLAASTPTDAARRVVPDLAEEQRAVTDLRRRARASVHRRLQRETEQLAEIPARLRAGIRARLRAEDNEVDALRQRARRCTSAGLAAAPADLAHVRARVRALSPQATLERGYAVVQRADAAIVRHPDDAVGRLRVRVAGGEFSAERTPAVPSPR
jgi:exodeoxyribonuclease VII large subunit